MARPKKYEDTISLTLADIFNMLSQGKKLDLELFLNFVWHENLHDINNPDYIACIKLLTRHLPAEDQLAGIAAIIESAPANSHFLIQAKKILTEYFDSKPADERPAVIISALKEKEVRDKIYNDLLNKLSESISAIEGPKRYDVTRSALEEMGYRGDTNVVGILIRNMYNSINLLPPERKFSAYMSFLDVRTTASVAQGVVVLLKNAFGTIDDLPEVERHAAVRQFWKRIRQYDVLIPQIILKTSATLKMLPEDKQYAAMKDIIDDPHVAELHDEFYPKYFDALALLPEDQKLRDAISVWVRYDHRGIFKTLPQKDQDRRSKAVTIITDTINAADGIDKKFELTMQAIQAGIGAGASLTDTFLTPALDYATKISPEKRYEAGISLMRITKNNPKLYEQAGMICADGLRPYFEKTHNTETLWKNEKDYPGLRNEIGEIILEDIQSSKPVLRFGRAVELLQRLDKAQKDLKDRTLDQAFKSLDDLPPEEQNNALITLTALVPSGTPLANAVKARMAPKGMTLSDFRKQMGALTPV